MGLNMMAHPEGGKDQEGDHVENEAGNGGKEDLFYRHLRDGLNRNGESDPEHKKGHAKGNDPIGQGLDPFLSKFDLKAALFRFLHD